MRSMKLLTAVLISLCSSVVALAQMPKIPPSKTAGDTFNAVLTIVSGEFVSAADAMPEDKYSFAPSSGEFKGVRTFAQQVKHVAATNYAFGSAILGEKPPVEGGENGPDNIKTKAEIMKFLNDSFDYLRKALASISDKNQLDEVSLFGEMKMARGSIGSFAVAHPMDHYGQMVEYLRMNGIVPPASRRQQ